MSSILEYSRVPFERGKDFSEDHLDAWSSRPNVNPIKIELCCFWKDIAENYLDVANFRPDARQPESESQQFLTLANQSPNLSSFWGLFKPINRGL